MANQLREPSLARVYFKKALRELNLEQKQFPSLVLSHSELSFEKPLYEELQSQWKEVLGITVLSQQLPWDEFSANLEKGNFQLGGLFRRDPFNHVLFYLSFFKNIPSNPHSLESEHYTQLFDKFYVEQTQESLKNIETFLIEESPVIPLISQQYLTLISSHVKGLVWEENGCFDLREVSLHE